MSRYAWVTMGVVLIGTFMVFLDTTIVNVALPQIGFDLHSGQGIEWIITGYLLAVGVSQPASGWLADRFGRKKIYTLSLAAFAGGSLMSALAPNLQALVGFRVFQGLGGGAMMPVGLAMIYELFPPTRRGTALGIWGIAAMAAPTVGPAAGGYIVTAFGWRWLFLLNVPIGAVGIVAALRLLRASAGFHEERPFDGVGWGLGTAGLLLLLLAFSEADSWGWSSAAMIGSIAGGLALLALFVRRELRTDDPLIDVRMFAVPVFSLTMILVALITTIQFGRLVFVPIDLETVRRYSAFVTGLILTPSAIGTALTMPLGGKLADLVGARTPVLAGVVILTLAAWFLGHLRAGSSVTWIILVLVIQGAGTGLALMPNTVTAMNALPARLVAQGSAVRAVNRQIAGSLGTAVLASIVAARIGTVSAGRAVPPAAGQAAYNVVYLIGFGAGVLAIVLAIFLPGRARMRELQRQRSEEFVAPAEA